MGGTTLLGAIHFRWFTRTNPHVPPGNRDSSETILSINLVEAISQIFNRSTALPTRNSFMRVGKFNFGSTAFSHFPHHDLENHGQRLPLGRSRRR